MSLLGAGTAPALADCQPASPSSGQTVNCTGNAPTGFQVTNPAVNNLNVIVQPGATVQDNGFFSIVVNNGNTVVNNGAVTGGAGVTGIAAIDGNTLTNNSAVTVGDFGVGLFVNNNSTINNAGTGVITAGNFATGIQITGTGSSATNAGSIIVGDNGLGVDISGADVGTRVVNNGSIVVGVGSACCSGIGIFLNAGQTAINNGTINTGDGATGIFALGDNNVITNAKAINVGAGAAAIGMFGNAETVTSSGTITGGLGSFGIIGNDNNIVTHSGMMTLGDLGTGIQLGNNNAVLNSGAITVGQLGTGIFVANNNTVTNGGTMTIGELGIAIEALDSNHIVNGGTVNLAAGAAGIIVFGANNAIINNGTMNVGDGGVGLISVAVAGSQNVLTNNGLIALASSTCCTSATGIDAGAGTLATNNKSIIGGDNTEGIVGFGGGNTLVNNGNIALGASTLGIGLSVGIDVSAVGGNTVINNGSIAVGAFGIGIATSDGNTITNNGSVVVGPNAVSIGNCGCFSSDNNVVVNNGTLDGTINLAGSANVFTNNGLITITDPGTAVGATHVIDGDFAQTAAGTLALRVTSAGVSDVLTVSGTATLGGTLKPVVQPGLYGTTTTYFGVVTAGNPIGTQFAQVTSPSAFLTASAIYHPNSVDLTLKRAAFGSLAGETQNQQAVGDALERAYSTGLTGSAATFFTNLLFAPSAAVLDQLSGEGTSATQNTAFSAGDQFMATLIDQFWLWRNGDRAGIPDAGVAPVGYAAQARMHPAFKAIPMAAPAFVPSWHAWAAGFGGSQSFNADPVVGSAFARNSSGGAALGVDYTVNPNLLLGVGVGGSASSFAVPDRATFGTVDGGHVGFYGMQRWGAAYATALLSYSRFDNTTTRTIAGIGPTEVANGSFASDLFGARFEVGRTWSYGRIGLTPFAAVQVSELRQRGYSETSMVVGGGPGILGLNFAPIAVNSLPTFLGAQLDTSVAFANGVVWSPYARASWVHEFDPTRQVTASFLLVPGASFAVDGARAASDSARIDLGSRLKITRRAALTATFTGEFSDRTQSYAGRAGLRMEF